MKGLNFRRLLLFKAVHPQRGSRMKAKINYSKVRVLANTDLA